MKVPVCFVVFFAITCAQNVPLVDIPTLGKLEGGHGVSLNGRSFYKFEGVPYARPPVGEYRFREPLPVEPWNGILEAKTIYKCVQDNQNFTSEGHAIIGDEDCLYLNIYTPNFEQNAKLDVLVHIHGGAFMFLYGGFQGPQYILDQDIVYINLNYRLGPFGFLCTENDVVPGNNGIKDQIFALQWIQNNVKYFGGNPGSVTISGLSAGGASVNFHYLSPKSRNLFHRGISQSGVMLNPWVLMEKPLEKAKRLSVRVGCPVEDTEAMVECLKHKPARQIMEVSVKEFQPWLNNPFSPFGLVIDTWASDPVLPEHPLKMIQNKQVADLPWIASYTESEGLYPAADFYDEKFLYQIDTSWNDLLPLILDYNYTVDPEIHDRVSQKIRKHYLDQKQVSKATFLDFVRIVSDRMFVVDIQKTVRLQASVLTEPIYFYYFTYRGAHSLSEPRSGTNLDFGASHTDDTNYVFKTDIDTSSTEEDIAMIQLFVQLVASFAKTGKPNVTVEWPALSKNMKDPLTYLKIESPKSLSIEWIANYDNEKFWDSLPIMENEKLFSGFKNEP